MARSIVRHHYNAHLKTLGLGPASSQKRAGNKATSVALVYPATRRTGQGMALGRAQCHQRRARLPFHAPHGPGDGAWPGTRPPALRSSTLPRAARARGRNRIIRTVHKPMTRLHATVLTYLRCRTSLLLAEDCYRCDGCWPPGPGKIPRPLIPGALHTVASAHGMPGCVCREQTYGACIAEGALAACLDSGWVRSAHVS